MPYHLTPATYNASMHKPKLICSDIKDRQGWHKSLQQQVGGSPTFYKGTGDLTLSGAVTAAVIHSPSAPLVREHSVSGMHFCSKPLHRNVSQCQREKVLLCLCHSVTEQCITVMLCDCDTITLHPSQWHSHSIAVMGDAFLSSLQVLGVKLILTSVSRFPVRTAPSVRTWLTLSSVTVLSHSVVTPALTCPVIPTHVRTMLTVPITIAGMGTPVPARLAIKVSLN